MTRRLRSAHVLHDTTDPDVFMAEIDVAFDEADGRRTTMSLLQVFRLRDGQIAKLRDYFSEVPSVIDRGSQEGLRARLRGALRTRLPEQPVD